MYGNSFETMYTQSIDIYCIREYVKYIFKILGSAGPDLLFLARPDLLITLVRG